MKYTVVLEEIAERTYVVDAESEDEALALAASTVPVEEVVTWPTILDVYEVEEDV